MGGWRCSYRNCKVKSDGKTHMFHYPVFDKVRCHQWLVNSGRLDFLNLKVSQLKNRVVCQHHFKTDNFMNFKKDKLKFDAIPTIDGPYCESNNSSIDNNFKHDRATEYSIIFDDIENEYMTLNDKKANYPVKYADFLSNNDLLCLDIPNYSNQSQINNVYDNVKNYEDQKNIDIEIPKVDIKIDLGNNSQSENNIQNTVEYYNKYTDDPCKNITIINTYQHKSPHPGTSKKSQLPPVLIVPPYSNNKTEDNQLSIEVELPPNFNVNFLSDSNNIGNGRVNMLAQNEPSTPQPLPPPLQPHTPLQSLKPKKSRITILSEKRISKPVTVTGKLELVSTSSILPLPHHNAKNNETVNIINVNTQRLDDQVVSQTPKISTESVISVVPAESVISVAPAESVISVVPAESVIPSGSAESVISTGPAETLIPIVPTDSIIPPVESLSSLKSAKMSIKKENKSQSQKPVQATSPKVSYLKNKITPERIAAIESKRKFNMKLRDIIESFLVKLDDQDKIDGEPKETKKISLQNKDVTEKVGSYLSKEAETPSLHDYTITYLDARLKKIEDTLATKIDQNSQRIVELQKSVEHKTEKRKSTSTQTSSTKESDKRRLYQEISKYLSPDANNIIYEELFINKYGYGIAKSDLHSPKRKRPR